MNRTRLENRRYALTQRLVHGDHVFHVSVGFYPDRRIGEVFAVGAKSGSQLGAMVSETCILMSWLLQRGCRPSDLRRAIASGGEGRPETICGAIVGLLEEIERDASPGREESDALMD